MHNRHLPTAYLENFPRNGMLGALWNSFSKFGEIVEICVPHKLNRRGQTVWVSRVRSMESLSTLLKDLIILVSSYKLVAFASRNNERQSTIATTNDHRDPRKNRGDWRNKAVHRNRHDQPEQKEVSMQNIRPNDANHAEPSGMDKEVKGFDICSVLNINNVPNLEEYFCADGVFTVKVLAMGGSTVLLTFESKKLMEHFLSVDPSWLQQLFIDIHPWQVTSTPSKRLACLRHMAFLYMFGRRKFLLGLGTKATASTLPLHEHDQLIIHCASDDEASNGFSTEPIIENLVDSQSIDGNLPLSQLEINHIVKLGKKNRPIKDIWGLYLKLGRARKCKWVRSEPTRPFLATDNEIIRVNKLLCSKIVKSYTISPLQEAVATLRLGEKLGLVFDEDDDAVVSHMAKQIAADMLLYNI
ncbi:hypothetical protein GH714_021221 [Hevea brasiliensis]|uniref:RRM domain-containing protein n=1 Tax=Hevea brasiliensis TaxID=3981 RepID=A0A6A6N522_HEVBR|nr:hypothetical protein GH714_021221 [Hevea brasiliensis]